MGQVADLLQQSDKLHMQACELARKNTVKMLNGLQPTLSIRQIARRLKRSPKYIQQVLDGRVMDLDTFVLLEKLYDESSTTVLGHEQN